MARSRRAARVALAVYAVVVALVTFGPSPGPALAAAGRWLAELLGEAGRGRDVVFSVTLEQFLNVLLTVPAGFLLPRAFARVSAWRAVTLVAAASALVELLQLVVFVDRVPRLSDVGLNTLGAVVGAALAGRDRR